MVLRIHGDANGHAKDPMIGKRLWPQGIYFEARRLDSVGFRLGLFLEHDRAGCECGEKRQENSSDVEVAFHVSLLFRTRGHDFG